MNAIKINKGPAPESELPRIVVKTVIGENDNQDTIATVILHEHALGSAPSKAFSILKDRVEMSREAALDFAIGEAKIRGIKHIYDIPVRR
jgi:uncharacterized protein YwlG (UPF0340 family)